MKTKLSVRLLAGLLVITAAACRDTPTGTGPADLGDTADAAVSSDDLAGSTTDLAAADLAGASPDMVPAADPTEFLVVRVGDGAAMLSSDATPVFVERRKIADGAMVGTPIALPTAVNGTSRRLTLSGTALSEGALSRSANGAYALLAGYDATVGIPNISATSPTTYNRVIGRIAANNSVDTTTAFDGLGTGSIRGAASTDGKALWASGTNGIVYTTFGSTAAPTTLAGTNARVLGLFSGQLYASSGSANVTGVNTVGNGAPTAAGATVTLLPGFSAQSNLSPYGFIAFDRDATPGIDTLYVADDRTTGGGLQRWRLVGTTWTLDGSFVESAGSGARAVTGYVSGSSVVLLVVVPEAGLKTARIVSFVDTGQNPSTATAKLLATANANTVYRGLCLAPQ
ncbi:MAG: hypothetical protein U1A78_34760 [Polyangia bacterium]